MRRNILITILGLASLVLPAQGRFSRKRNAYRDGDVIVKQQVEYLEPGSPGVKSMWNFSRLNPVNEKYNLVYFTYDKEDTVHITGLEHETRYDYEQKDDTLWLTGYTNRTTEMTYSRPEAQLRYPFHYGDSLYTRFIGKGSYCRKIDLAAKGETFVMVDATGMLITPEGDTLKKVTRVKRIRSYTEIGVDSVKLKLETYSWYALGYRYPVFETVKSWENRGDSTWACFGTSFYYPIRNLAELAEDTVNMNIRNNEAQSNDILLSCTTYPNPVVSELAVNYELSQDAHVSFRLCDIGGRPWMSQPAQTMAAGKQGYIIPMSGFPPGDYALYITVDGYAHRYKVIKQ
jgi:hypothetical protein